LRQAAVIGSALAAHFPGWRRADAQVLMLHPSRLCASSVSLLLLPRRARSSIVPTVALARTSHHRFTLSAGTRYFEFCANKEKKIKKIKKTRPIDHYLPSHDNNHGYNCSG
jgi:hypothetical protein